jgi:hypothetical protein
MCRSSGCKNPWENAETMDDGSNLRAISPKKILRRGRGTQEVAEKEGLNWRSKVSIKVLRVREMGLRGGRDAGGFQHSRSLL